MDSEDTKSVVTQVRKYFDHDAAKQILKEKYEAKMLFTAFGGLWKAGPGLFALLVPHMLEAGFHPETAPREIVLLDEYGNPCKADSNELYDMAWQRWQEQMNGWYAEFQELQQKR